jgi:hypothetical protein
MSDKTAEITIVPTASSAAAAAAEYGCNNTLLLSVWSLF